MGEPFWTRLLVKIKTKDASSYIHHDLLSFSYTDKETDEAEEISFTLKDEHGKWAGSWTPDAASDVECDIVMGDKAGKLIGTLSCGKFRIDSVRVSGSPRVCEMRGVSIPLEKPIRRKTKNRAWEKKTLKDIASAIAGENGMKLFWDCAENPFYDRLDQSKESDLAFLSRLCKDNGFSVKVTSEKIVIFDQAVYEKKDPVRTYELKKSPVLSWDFSQERGETYKSVKVSYRDPKQKKAGKAASKTKADAGTPGQKDGKNPAVHEYVFTDSSVGKEGQEYVLKKRCKSQAEAERLAKAKLRELNAKSVTGNLTVVGDCGLAAGEVVEISGFGSFDGNFIVQECRHTVGTSGYTSAMSLRRVNEKY